MDCGVFNMSDDFALRTYAGMVYRVAVRYTQNLADAEDVFSDTFLAYYARKQDFENETHRKAWLLRVAINFSHTLRHNGRRFTELDAETPLMEPGFEQVESSVDLKDALKRMRPDYREVLCLFYLDELSVKEISEVLDRNESTIRTQLSRAREQLRKFLSC